MHIKSGATIEDLYRTEGKAELVAGEVVAMPLAGDDPERAGFEIVSSLREYVRSTRRGLAIPDNVGFRVNIPHRGTFSPYDAYYTGRRTGMRFLGYPRKAGHRMLSNR